MQNPTTIQGPGIYTILHSSFLLYVKVNKALTNGVHKIFFFPETETMLSLKKKNKKESMKECNRFSFHKDLYMKEKVHFYFGTKCLVGLLFSPLTVVKKWSNNRLYTVAPSLRHEALSQRTSVCAGSVSKEKTTQPMEDSHTTNRKYKPHHYQSPLKQLSELLV